MTTLLLRLCENLAQNLRSLSNTDCTSHTKLQASCASCLTIDQWAKDVAHVVERHAKSYKAFEASSNHSPHFKQTDDLDSFLHSLLSGSEMLIKDIDCRLVASRGATVTSAEVKANHYHYLVNFFKEDKGNANTALPNHAGSAGPRFGSYRMQLRMDQVDHITSILELLEEVERHATPYFCNCGSAVKQETHDMEVPKTAQRVIQTRTRLLLSESRGTDDLPKISIMTKKLPGFSYSKPSLTSLLSQCYQPSEICPSPRNGNQKESIQNEQPSADNSQELEALEQLLRSLNGKSTPIDGRSERFVGDIQALRSQHEALLRDANGLVKQISDARVSGDCETTPGITTTKLDHAIFHYIFQEQPRSATRSPVKMRSHVQCRGHSSVNPWFGGLTSRSSSEKNEHSATRPSEKEDLASAAPPPYTEDTSTRTKRWFGVMRLGKS